MADNFEHPGHDDPQGGSPPGDDFPADFFDDQTEPSPVSLTPHEPIAAPPHEPPTPRSSPPPPPMPVNEPPPPAIGPPSAYRAPDVTPMEDEGIKMSAFPAVLGVLMFGVLVAAWFASKQKVEPPPVVASTTPAPSTSPEPVAAAAPASAVDTESLEKNLKDLSGKVEEVTAQVKALEAKLNDLPKPEPAPDLKPLESKLNDLTKSVASVAPLNEKVGKVDDRFGSVEGELKSIKGEFASLKEEVRKATAASPKPANEPKPEGEGSSGALTEGVNLFKAGKYKEADEVFKKLASGNPKDARVYYYAALTRGLTANDWQGETLATASKGAELEKAGSPKASDVDAAFADLPANLKPWVTFFRKQAK